MEKVCRAARPPVPRLPPHPPPPPPPRVPRLPTPPCSNLVLNQVLYSDHLENAKHTELGPIPSESGLVALGRSMGIAMSKGSQVVHMGCRPPWVNWSIIRCPCLPPSFASTPVWPHDFHF